MVYIAGNFEDKAILCNVPAHTIRINLKDRRWISDIDPESAVVDKNDNGIPVEFVLLGFTPFFGTIGFRQGQEFIRLSFISVSPKHRLLPPRCVTTALLSGKSSQKNFISYFQSLYNNRINCAGVITSTKFVGKSFMEKDPLTGEDKSKISYNVLEFADRNPETEDEKLLMEDVSTWMETEGAAMLPSVLRSHISGGNLVELPLGADHGEIKKKFLEEFPIRETDQLPSQTPSSLPPAAPVESKEGVTITKEQAKALGLDF